MRKNILVGRVVKHIIALVIVFYFLFTGLDISKLALIPFVICAISIVGKDIFILLNKNQLANICDKIFKIGFLIFWFGTIIFASYTWIKEKQYTSLIFTLPFWIVGIYIIRKYLFKNVKTNTTQKNTVNVDFRVIISSLLVGSVLIIGIVCFTIGVKDTYKLNKISKDYIKTTGYFTDYTIYSQDEDETTYKLIYNYQVDDKTYTISTDYGVCYIPEKESTREVKYNPENHKEAILVGINSKNGLIYFGLFFMLGATAFILFALQIKGVFDKVKLDIIGAYFGFVLFLIGIGIILFQLGTTSSLIEVIKSFGLWIIIPVLMVLVGAVQTIKSLFLIKKK